MEDISNTPPEKRGETTTTTKRKKARFVQPQRLFETPTTPQVSLDDDDDENHSKETPVVLAKRVPPKKPLKRGFVLPARVATPQETPQQQPHPTALLEKNEGAAALVEPNEEEEEEEVLAVVKKPKKRKRVSFRPPGSSRAQASYLPHEPLELSSEIRVPGLICQFLRPHQRVGVQFLFECVSGRRQYPETSPGGSGAILADGMGLGKTITTIALVYALLQKGTLEGKQIRRAIVVCPCSLVGNWDNEFSKWINSRTEAKNERVEVRAVVEGNRAATEAAIETFLAPSRPFHVLVLSYESLRANISRLSTHSACDLLVADEAQRLKGAKTQVNVALGSLPCRRRILLTGTPLQNDLDEFHAMSDAANPGALGTVEAFRKYFAQPILAAREPDASSEAGALGGRRQTELAALAKCFVLRRENRLNALHLPPKLDLVVCCKMPPAQTLAYDTAINDKQLQHALAGKKSDAFKYIDKLLKTCNHPRLLLQQQQQQGPPEEKKNKKGDRDDVLPLEKMSAKLYVVFRLMREMRRRDEGERIVIVANATASLEVVAELCDREGWPWCILDGKTPIKKRKQLNLEFNDPKSHHFAFLLSSTAGGCGLNLIGANRLVLYDSSWNPATDKQAAARCWRDGNKRRCFTYRLVSTGTIEEKMYQRQLSKEGLLSVIEDKEQINSFSTVELRRLFVFEKHTASDTHAMLNCTCEAATTSYCRMSEQEDPNALGPKRASACREYVVAETIVLVASLPSLPEEAKEVTQKVIAHLEAVRAQILPDVSTLPLVRREIDRGFVDLAAKADPAGLETLEKLRANLQRSWHDLVHKVYAIDERDEDPTKLAPAPAIEKDAFKPQLGMPTEEDLRNWGHHASVATVDDDVLRAALKGGAERFVSFVFTLETTATLIAQAEKNTNKSTPPPEQQQQQQHKPTTTPSSSSSSPQGPSSNRGGVVGAPSALNSLSFSRY
ncbi:hypothetical protein CTAYLR_002531 [Chrysophaeum taylorii]|uniref:Uncharacterized protein n=1 Tax=Chrysophaeum taylorii TaxID=2483200 RepID=A0AAD7XPX0_9STRA|nr:hypothetical protein CTAYLR_002531 [Chrysophaeum taylorii]